MRLISTAEQCRTLDRYVIDTLGVPGVALMELASRGVADVVCEHLAHRVREGVTVLVGKGNNGGDGWGVARWLHLRGIAVTVVAIGEPATPDARTLQNASRRAGVPEESGIPTTCGVVIDALFGTGLTRAVGGRAAELLRSLPETAARVAVDVPSGMCANTGQWLGTPYTAHHTVTFGRMKPAFFTPGGVAAGQVHLVDIGWPTGDHAAATTTSLQDVRDVWPIRHAHAYKQSSGHLAVVAGSQEMAGAAVLTCLGALRAGAGLVTLFIEPEAVPRLTTLPPTVMVQPGPLHAALSACSRFSAVAVGPGLAGGKTLGPREVAQVRLLLASECPVVADADALAPGLVLGPNAICTPHAGEAGRMLACSSTEIQADRFAAVGRLPGTAVLKGRHTLIHHAGRTHVNLTGAPTLATAGSGDVLTGVVGALLARGLSAPDAALAGVWVHGRAGEILQTRRVEGWSATDIADAVPDAIQEVVDVSR